MLEQRDTIAQQRRGTYDGKCRLWGFNKSPIFDAWTNGKILKSPGYLIIEDGKYTHKIGFHAGFFQDFTQNGIHQNSLFTYGNQNYYLDYREMQKGLYLYSGPTNPYTLYNY